MILYDYWRSSAAWRVRIALALKGVSVERRFVNLLSGAQRRADYLATNPQALVPALELDDGSVLTQSLAIIDYLEMAFPQPRLIPTDPVRAAHARAAALAIACDIHPLGNVRVADYLARAFDVCDEAVANWRRHWIIEGLGAIEAMIRPEPFCFGPQPSIADICLAPQLYNAGRFGVPLHDFPNVRSVGAACAAHPAFVASHPSAQPDAEQTARAP